MDAGQSLNRRAQLGQFRLAKRMRFRVRVPGVTKQFQHGCRGLADAGFERRRWVEPVLLLNPGFGIQRIRRIGYEADGRTQTDERGDQQSQNESPRTEHGPTSLGGKMAFGRFDG
jgi:hypothetical protein